MRHIILTGEVGAGKSTVLERTLQLLDAHVEGIKTGAYEPREAKKKTLYMRAYGDEAMGCPFACMPGADKAYAARCFDSVGVQLLRRAGHRGELIVIDELGWLECDAAVYQQTLKEIFDGDVPVLAVLRQNKAGWADWIRNRPDTKLLLVNSENRNSLPELAAGILCRQIRRRDDAYFEKDERICYTLDD